MLRATFFAPFSDGDIKGVERRINFLSEELRANGARAAVINRRFYLRLLAKFRVRWMKTLGLERVAIFLVAEMIARRRRDDIVISEVILAPVWRRNFALTVHDLKMFDKDARRRGALTTLIYSIFLRLAHSIVVVSRHVGDEMSAMLGPDKSITLIYNGISSAQMARSLPFARQYIATDRPKKFDFVYVASFAKHKGHDVIVAAAPAGSKICFVGRDLGTLEMVKTAIRNRQDAIAVTILQDVDDDAQLFSILSSARTALFPSSYEGFGIPILEYALIGLRCIASDLRVFEEFAELIDEFVPAGDIAAWATAMSGRVPTLQPLRWKDIVARRAMIESNFGGARVLSDFQVLKKKAC